MLFLYIYYYVSEDISAMNSIYDRACIVMFRGDVIVTSGAIRGRNAIPRRENHRLLQWSHAHSFLIETWSISNRCLFYLRSHKHFHKNVFSRDNVSYRMFESVMFFSLSCNLSLMDILVLRYPVNQCEMPGARLSKKKKKFIQKDEGGRENEKKNKVRVLRERKKRKRDCVSVRWDLGKLTRGLAPQYQDLTRCVSPPSRWDLQPPKPPPPPLSELLSSLFSSSSSSSKSRSLSPAPRRPLPIISASLPSQPPSLSCVATPRTKHRKYFMLAPGNHPLEVANLHKHVSPCAFA